MHRFRPQQSASQRGLWGEVGRGESPLSQSVVDLVDTLNPPMEPVDSFIEYSTGHRHPESVYQGGLPGYRCSCPAGRSDRLQRKSCHQFFAKSLAAWVIFLCCNSCGNAFYIRIFFDSFCTPFLAFAIDRFLYRRI